jgi:hypothetical protein
VWHLHCRTQLHSNALCQQSGLLLVGRAGGERERQQAQHIEELAEPGGRVTLSTRHNASRMSQREWLVREGRGAWRAHWVDVRPSEAVFGFKQ